MTTYHYKYYSSVLYLISIMLYSNHINPNVISKFYLKETKPQKIKVLIQPLLYCFWIVLVSTIINA